MIHKMNKTTFLSAIFLSIIATVAIFSASLLLETEGSSNLQTKLSIKSDYVTAPPPPTPSLTTK